MVGECGLDLCHRRIVPSRGAVDTSQRESCLWHLGGGLARLFGVVLGVLERRPVDISQIDLPQRLAQAHVGENEVRVKAKCLAEIFGSGIRSAKVIDAVEKSASGDVVVERLISALRVAG